jgi:hypothetical protein
MRRLTVVPSCLRISVGQASGAMRTLIVGGNLKRKARGERMNS